METEGLRVELGRQKQIDVYLTVSEARKQINAYSQQVHFEQRGKTLESFQEAEKQVEAKMNALNAILRGVFHGQETQADFMQWVEMGMPEREIPENWYVNNGILEEKEPTHDAENRQGDLIIPLVQWIGTTLRSLLRRKSGADETQQSSKA
jgi:hypothetical protein